MKRPTIVCLCGSTRFWKTFQDEGLRLTLEGKIVLSIGICSPDSETLAHSTDIEGIKIKQNLDKLHLNKISLADEILVLNVGRYIGESTRNEIAWAIVQNKIIKYLEEREIIDINYHDFGQRVAMFLHRNKYE